MTAVFAIDCVRGVCRYDVTSRRRREIAESQYSRRIRMRGRVEAHTVTSSHKKDLSAAQDLDESQCEHTRNDS